MPAGDDTSPRGLSRGESRELSSPFHGGDSQKEVTENMKRVSDEQGEFGIGSLIIFVAMVIVSAVTATLLINVAYQLQQQAQQTSNQALQDVSTGVKIISMGGYRYNASWGTNAPYHPRIDWITLKITLIAGSAPINISTLVVEVSDGYSVATLTFNEMLHFNSNSQPPDISGSYFGAYKIRDLDPVDAHVLTQGDIEELYFNATGVGLNLEPQTHIEVKIIPKSGVPADVSLMTPSPYITRYVELM